MTDAGYHIDLDAIRDLKEVMGEEFSLLIETFATDSVMRIEGINQAINSADPEAIRRAAHSFKGSASNLGATELTNLCRELEDLGHEGKVEGATQIAEKIVKEYDYVREVLQSL